MACIGLPLDRANGLRARDGALQLDVLAANAGHRPGWARAAAPPQHLSPQYSSMLARCLQRRHLYCWAACWTAAANEASLSPPSVTKPPPGVVGASPVRRSCSRERRLSEGRTAARHSSRAGSASWLVDRHLQMVAVLQARRLQTSEVWICSTIMCGSAGPWSRTTRCTSGGGRIKQP